MSLEKRLQRLEYQEIVRGCEAYTVDTHVSAAQLLAEFHRVFSLPDAEQRAYYQNLYARLTPEEAAELDAIRHRYTRILRSAR